MQKVTNFILSTLLLLTSVNAHSVLFEGAIIKVYSDGKLVASYEARPGGEFVGSCYVFDSNSEIHRKKITVCGTFVVEEKK